MYECARDKDFLPFTGVRLSLVLILSSKALRGATQDACNHIYGSIYYYPVVACLGSRPCQTIFKSGKMFETEQG